MTTVKTSSAAFNPLLGTAGIPFRSRLLLRLHQSHHTHPLHPAGSIVVRQRSWRSLEDQDISNDIHWHFYAVGSGGGHISATEMASRELYRSKISEAEDNLTVQL
ncbi:hypothetical protein P3342_002854 [Pyrenophora teres f. teres]|uniref:Uncharacterized protein n=1 Tax=Pyrenophora teres f. teres (strain 0-1) TaxID=861557 RepID=E3RPR4_PYRTT|nr:hypothetical protein PTT_10658 [Pyrenophora teres f. teres 0-1]KAK1915049.1 hypothetical protein P3342_002854 [Pyrenophora teres f. teres]